MKDKAKKKQEFTKITSGENKGDFLHKDGDIYPRHVVKRIRPELFK